MSEIERESTPKLFVVSAPSGGGKTTLASRVLKKIPQLVRSVSATTRPPRSGEAHKRDYFFMSPRAFASTRKRRGFLESARVFGYWYGTPRTFVQKMLRQKKDVLLLIDVQGARSVKKSFSDAVLIFIVPPSLKILGERLRKRSTDSEANILKRLRIARRELQSRSFYDYIIKNDRVDRAATELESIIIAERLKS